MKTVWLATLLLGAGAALAQPVRAPENSGGARAACEGNIVYSTIEWAYYTGYDRATGNGYGGLGLFGGLYDLQIADDFWTTDDNVITCVTGAYVSFLGIRSAGGLQVDIWTHTGA